MGRLSLSMLVFVLLLSACDIPTQPGLIVASPPGEGSADSPRSSAVRFSETRPAFVEQQSVETGGECNMETIQGSAWTSDTFVVADRTSIRITGWGFDGTRKILAHTTVLRLQDAAAHEWYIPTEPVDRPDVAQHFGDPTLTLSGYVAEASAEDLPEGEYQAMILMDSGGRTILCSSGRKLRLTALPPSGAGVTLNRTDLGVLTCSLQRAGGCHWSRRISDNAPGSSQATG